MGGMVITFLLSIGGMIGQARLDSMLGLDGQSGEFIFIFGAASTYLTSFCFHASVLARSASVPPLMVSVSRSI